MAIVLAPVIFAGEPLSRAVVPAIAALTASVPKEPIAIRAVDVPVRVLLSPPSPRRGILDAANFVN